jgi:hypothetical protein
MKKFNIAVLLVLFGMSVVISGCKKTKEDNCLNLTNNVEAALTAFGNNPTQATCEAYYNAMQDYIDGCKTITPATKAYYEDLLSSTDCSVFKK